MTGVAVIGCGQWGRNHIRCFANQPDCHVIAVDLDEARRQDISSNYPQMQVTASYQQVLADDSVSAVVIATPASTHFQLVRQALRAGKHVLCEKPLCTTVAEARVLVDLSEQCRLVLMTGHLFLFNPGIIKIRELITQGQLGNIRHISAVRTNLGPIRGDVNAAFDLAAHDVSVINWLLNAEPIKVSAAGGDFLQPGIHDIAFINLSYPDGQVAHIHVSWLNPEKNRKMTVVGDSKMVTWDDLQPNSPVTIFDRGVKVDSGDQGRGEFALTSIWNRDVQQPAVETTEPLILQCECFLQGLHEGSLARSNGRFSLGVVRVLEAVQQSLDNNGDSVALCESDSNQAVATSVRKLTIPFVDLQAQTATIRDEIKVAIDAVISQSDFILGSATSEFEAAFADLVGVEHAIGVASGLDALRLSLMALGIGRDDEVILPANTYIATALAVSSVHATPVLVDCDRHTYNLDVALVEAAITPQTRALIPVHLTGQAVDMGAVIEIAKRYGLPIIEDACQAHGTVFHNRSCGSFGTAGCFSFYPGKNLGSYGDGGIVTTDDAGLAERLRMLRNYGQREKYNHVVAGVNSRLDTLQAAILNVKLPYLADWNRARAAHADQYRLRLEGVGDLRFQSLQAGSSHVYHLFIVETEHRELLAKHLAERGIQSGIHYPTPIHLQPAYSHLGHVSGDFPNTESLAKRILSLPMFPELTSGQIEHITASIQDFFKKR